MPIVENGPAYGKSWRSRPIGMPAAPVPLTRPNTSIGSPHGVLGRSTSSVIAVGSRAVVNVRVLLVLVPAALVAVSR